MRFGQHQKCFGIRALQSLTLATVGLGILMSWTALADAPPTTAAGDGADNSTLGSSSGLRSKLEAYGPGLERGDQMWSSKDYVQLDELMRNTVLESFEATFDFAKTQILLAELVHWQELPSTLSVGFEEPEQRLSIPGLEDFTRSLPSGEARMPVILWKGVEIPGHGTLYAFQNSIWEGYYTRVRCNPYAVLVSDHVVWSGVVIKLEGYSQNSFEDKEFLVDAISIQGIPAITTVGRPGGHLGVLNGHCLALDDAKGKWESIDSFLIEGGIGGWSYDSASYELSLQFIPNARELGFESLSPVYKLPDPELIEEALQKREQYCSAPAKPEDNDLPPQTAEQKTDAAGQPEQAAQHSRQTEQSRHGGLSTPQTLTLDEAISKLRAANERYYEKLSAVLSVWVDENGHAVDRHPQPDVMQVLWEELPVMDEALHQCLETAFNTLRDVNSVSQALREVAQFREVEAGTFDVRGSFHLPGASRPTKLVLTDEERLPEVLYWTVDSQDGTRIFVLQNSLLRPMRGWGRGITVPYVVTVTSEGAKVSTFPELGDGIDSFTCAYPPPQRFYYFLDAIPTERAKPTLIIVLYGVAQEVDFDLRRADFDPQEGIWRLGWGLAGSVPPEGGRISPNLFYERETHKLHYSYSMERFGKSTSATFDVADSVRKGDADQQEKQSGTKAEGPSAQSKVAP